VKKDPYVGIWVNLTGSPKELRIRSEGEAYVIQDEKDEEYVGTKNNGVLHVSRQFGALDILYAESSDRLIAAGDEYERLDPQVTAKVKASTAELVQTIVDEAKSSGTHNDAKIRSAIVAKARENNLPVAEQNVTIVRQNGEIKVTVDYVVPITLPSGKVFNWRLQHKAMNPIF
jgi:hypothetical protein